MHGGAAKLNSVVKKVKTMFGGSKPSTDGYSKKIFKINKEQKSIPGGCLSIYVVADEEEYYYKEYVVPIKFLNESKRLQLFLDQYEDYIRDMRRILNQSITLPCSTQVFENELDLVKAELKQNCRAKQEEQKGDSWSLNSKEKSW